MNNDSPDSLPPEPAEFLSEFSTTLLPLENPKIIGIIEQFITDLQREVTGFLRKKARFEFNAVNVCDPMEVRAIENPAAFASFQIQPEGKYGLLFFPFDFLHHTINLLFGGSANRNEDIMRGLGKSGQTIARKITEMSLGAFQNALSSHIPVTLECARISDVPGLVLNQLDNTQLFNFSFKATIDGLESRFHIAIPEPLIELLSIPPEPPKVTPSEMATPTIDSRKRSELIDSTVTVSAILPSIKIQLKDVLNLKSGDTIPVKDPNEVYLMLNNKRLFRATPGKSNDVRVVKIEEML